jgi:acetyl-CoA C-acetyltransferase
MPHPVYVIGTGRTDFKRNFRKEDKSIRDLIVEAGRAAIADAAIAPKDVQAAVVGNFASGLFTRQLHLGAYVTDIDEALVGIPTMHVEAACASGGVAVLTAAQQIMGGIYDRVLVIGAEQQKTMSPADGADVLGAAADYRAEKANFGEFMFPKLFARIAELYMQRYGLSEQDLARVAVKNRAHARLNPLAQMRDSTLSLEQACCASDVNPRIAPPLKVTDCSQITDGAAAVVLSSRPARRSIRLSGWGHTTDHLPLDRKRAPEFPVARRAAQQAYAMARLTPGDIHAADVHDCFSISEVVAYEILGFAGDGNAGELLRSGATTLPQLRDGDASRAGSIVVNPGGGLIGDGHPVGATGVRQVVEAFAQLTGAAGARQVENAQRYLTFNMGGSVTTSVVMIWSNEA